MTTVVAQHTCVGVGTVTARRTTTTTTTTVAAVAAVAAAAVHSGGVPKRQKRGRISVSKHAGGRSGVHARARSAAAIQASSSSAAAEAEADPAVVYAIRDTTDDGTEVVSSAAWVEAREGETESAGVYGVYDTSENLQYVGYTQDVVRAVTAHRGAVGDERANKVRVAVFANKSMATRANLRAEADRWIGEWVVQHGGEDSAVPPGKSEFFSFFSFFFFPSCVFPRTRCIA